IACECSATSSRAQRSNLATPSIAPRSRSLNSGLTSRSKLSCSRSPSMASLPAVSKALATPFRGSENETSSTSEIRQRATLLRRPSDQSEQSSQPPSRFRRRRTPDSGTFGPRSPLPPLAEIFYTHGGCWNLVLAIHERTGLPIEVYYGGRRLTHLDVVAGDTPVDPPGR